MKLESQTLNSFLMIVFTNRQLIMIFYLINELFVQLD